MSRNKPNNNRVYSVPGTLRQITAKEKSFAGGPMNLRPGSAWLVPGPGARPPPIGSTSPMNLRRRPGWWWARTRAAARRCTASRGRRRRRRRRRIGGRWGCGACTRRWGSIYTHDVRRRWGSVFWRPWTRVIRGRLPVIGRPNADILHHGPPPAYAHGREAVGGAEAWPQVHPPARRRGSCAGHAWRCVRPFLPEIYLSMMID